VALIHRVLVCVIAVVSAAGVAPAQGAEPELTVDLGGGVRIELVLVKAGSFTQGSPPGEAGRGDDETQRRVTISRDFYVGKLEVTRLQFARFAQETGYRTEAEKGTSGGFGWDGQGLVQRKEFTWKNPGFAQTDDHPVVLVTYDDALAFGAWLSRKTRRTVALPTEAQWEYAARAGSTSRFYAGDAEDEARTIAWFKANAGNGTQAVGQKKPNRFGLHDVAGNAYEWCRDWYGPYAPGPVTDPEETRSTLSDKPRRVLRGGSWLKDAKASRSAARYRNTPGSRNADNGFRVVASVEEITGAAAPPLVGSARATTAPRTPIATPPASDGAGGLASLGAGLVCVLVTVLALVGAAIFLLRRGRGMATGYPGVTARLGPDGFWLKAPRAPQGSTVRYRVVVDGVPQEGEIHAWQQLGKEQFVYTGGKPSSVKVLGLAAAAGLVGAAAARASRPGTRTDEIDEVEEQDSTPSFRGFPSAY
jgi:formylglycine-generating enzyme required for sulfatase activity